MELDIVTLSRLQFALTAMYHFLFVPLTLGLSTLLAVMETVYVMTMRPMEPRPRMMTVSPGRRGVRLTARTQQASGSTNEPSSSLRFGGRRRVVCCTCRAGTRMYSAKPHGSILEVLNEAHME